MYSLHGFCDAAHIRGCERHGIDSVRHGIPIVGHGEKYGLHLYSSGASGEDDLES